ncbi:DUF2255 family protein [Demequina capsici]|uniref:DUF2255 family protein n=1 Tax=Demequina capsici TaxID=3075620 RepID=A0AA96FDT2_9MICO|nr:DUF2255 family protein [Demequina sp. PMTSA13]WNM28494.1 DUF2255 family protein [Demequina sp. PMTSA13]
MGAWTSHELATIAQTDELRIASRRPDGTLRPWVTIWVAREGDDIYVRSAHGVDNPWFRRASRSGRGRVSAGGVERDVVLELVPADAAEHPRIDAELHAKYDRYGPAYVGAITGASTYEGTFQVVPE